GDGITDFDEVGGLPEQVTYTVDGKEYTSVLFLGSVNDKLSTDFIYVDGRVNRDGTINNEKMGYVPYSNALKEAWYIDDSKDYFFRGKEPAYRPIGTAGLYQICTDKVEEASKYLPQYAYMNDLVVVFLTNFYLWMSLDCFATYLTTKGGPEPGIDGMGTRKYVDINMIPLREKDFFEDSTATCFKENMYKAIKAAESVLNEYNTEVYIAVSPNADWGGCFYFDEAHWDTEWKKDIESIAFLNMVGTFNKADAGVTLHATYDPKTGKYKMEYQYYLMDYYNFDFADIFKEQEALGLTRSYELYGEAQGQVSWKKGQQFYVLFPQMIVKYD
ncbi:MAG: hypothetical protein K2O32_00075, partial [Acetatifactor sp.]|nr:hypothetical protein [Acetatifactor sp.]